jgi:putative ABC transport system ATP-binding protein
MRQLMELLSELHRAGQTILLITHNQQIVERYANQVWQLRDGAVTERLTTDNESGGN